MQLVLEWARNIAGKVGLKVPNFEPKTWQDGKLFCALITHYRPDLLRVEVIDCAMVFQAAEVLGITISLDLKKPEIWNTWAVSAQVLEFYETLSGRDVISSPGIKRHSMGGIQLSPTQMEQATGLPNLSHLSSSAALAQSMSEWLGKLGLKRYLKKSLDFGFDDPSAIRLMQRDEIIAWAEAVGMKRKHRDLLLQGWMKERAPGASPEVKKSRSASVTPRKSALAAAMAAHPASAPPAAASASPRVSAPPAPSALPAPQAVIVLPSSAPPPAMVADQVPV
jgi:hypothetical protein